MQIIPVLPKSCQTSTAQLGGQSCSFRLAQKSVGLLLDFWVDDRQIVASQICRDRCRLIRLNYLGFVGDLAFIDTQGTSDPQSSGLGERWKLIYLPA